MTSRRFRSARCFWGLVTIRMPRGFAGRSIWTMMDTFAPRIMFSPRCLGCLPAGTCRTGVIGRRLPLPVRVARRRSRWRSISKNTVTDRDGNSGWEFRTHRNADRCRMPGGGAAARGSFDDGGVEDASSFGDCRCGGSGNPARSEEHTSELQSQSNLVCRLLLEKKKKKRKLHERKDGRTKGAEVQ